MCTWLNNVTIFLGKDKTSQTPGSGADQTGEIHKSSAQKQEGGNDAHRS